MPPHSKPKDTTQMMKSAAYEGKGTFACSLLHRLCSAIWLCIRQHFHIHNQITMPPHSKRKGTTQIMKSAAYEGKGTFACSRLHHLGSAHSLEAGNI